MHTPSRWIFIVSLLLVVAAVLGGPLHVVATLAPYTLYLALAGWLALTIGCFVKTT